MALQLLAIGALSLWAQIALLREVAVAAYGNELAWVLALGVWTAGTGAGALIGRRHADGATPSQRDRSDDRAVRWLFVAVAALLPATLAWVRASRVVLGAVPGGLLPLLRQLIVLVTTMAPCAALFGQLFRRGARRWAADGHTLGSAYALESAGALVGAGTATLALRTGVPTTGALLLCALGAWAVARPGRAGLALGSVVVIAALAAAPVVDRVTTGWAHRGLVAAWDSPYGRIAVSRWEGQVNVFVDDALAYETGSTAAEEYVALAALQHPAPRRVLVLGGGITGLVRQALAYHPVAVESVELDAILHRQLTRWLPDSLRAPLTAPVVRTVFDDPRRYLTARAAGAPPYDLILGGMPEPLSGRTNRYYTQEFFATCAIHLSRDGVLALRLPAAENFWSPPLVYRMSSIDRALRDVFPHVLFLPSNGCVVLASRHPLTRDAAVLASRLGSYGFRGRVVSPAWLDYVLRNDRVDRADAVLADAVAPMNRDMRPICYQYSLMLWLEQFLPAGVRPDILTGRAGERHGAGDTGPRPRHGPGRATVALGAVAAVALLRVLTRRPSARAVLIVATAGAVGMLMESLLLLAYQARNGVLYQDFGALLMVFMGGVALGAQAAGGASGHRMTAGALAILVAAGSVTALWIQLGVAFTFWLVAADLLVVGMGTGASFTAVTHAFEGRPGGAGLLYGADVVGGCVGALAGSLLLLPWLGLRDSALGAAALAAMACLWA